MGIPLDVMVDLGRVLEKHGVTHLGFEEMNAMIAALSPCFKPGYLAPHPKKDQVK